VTATAPPALVAALPQYEVGDSIGAGGMGVVFAALHRPLGRRVAIKQLPGGRGEDPAMAQRFDHEARLLASLDHPHIVPVYDYVQTDGVRLLVMEKLDGGSVHSRFHGPGLTGEQACAIGLAMLSGLHAAHQAGVLHLDVKPKNLLFTSSGVLKVADFGISRVVSEGATLVTCSGEAIGTPAYIAPEQALGNPLTPAADLYAAGTVLYELLSGVLPYESSDGGALALLHQHVHVDARPIQGVAPALASVIMRSLVRDPHERYRDAEAFALDLAAAATQAYGLGWLDRSGVPVHLTPRVAAGATTGPARPTVPVSVVRGAAPTATRRTPPPTLANPTLMAGPPTAGGLAGGALAGGGLAGQTLVPARELIAPPRGHGAARWFRLGALAGLVALAAVLMLALHGAAGPARPDPLALTVNGTPATAAPTLDLTNPVQLAGTIPGSTATTEPATAGPAATPDGLTATLRLSVLGIGLGSSTPAAVTTDGTGAWQATIDPPAAARWLAGGAVTAEVSLDGTAAERFTARPAQSPLLSAMGAGSVLLLMFTLAYLESIVRSVRRCQLRRSAPVLAAPVGAVFAAAAYTLAAALTRHEPTAPVLITAAALGALTAAAAILGTTRHA
jgi:eukaryotic-like serine/threonine-protein kinase